MDMVIGAVLLLAGYEVIVRILQRNRIIATRQAREKMHAAIQRLDRVGRVIQ